jgi:excisionase family DNA binding protein
MCARSRKTATTLTLGQASEVIQVSKTTLRRLADRGAIRASRTGKRGDRRFRAQDVAIFLLMENKGFRLAPMSSAKRRAGGDGKSEWVINRESLSSVRSGARDRATRSGAGRES